MSTCCVDFTGFEQTKIYVCNDVRRDLFSFPKPRHPSLILLVACRSLAFPKVTGRVITTYVKEINFETVKCRKIWNQITEIHTYVG